MWAWIFWCLFILDDLVLVDHGEIDDLRTMMHVVILAELGKPDWGQIALWGGVTLLSFIAFAVGVFILRRRLRDSGGTHADIFDLHELQEMRDRGDINEAEYKALRTQAVDALMMQGDRRER